MNTHRDRGCTNLRTLDYRVLLGARGMFEGYVCDRAVTTYEIRALTTNMEQICARQRRVRSYRTRCDAPTCSSPLNTYSRHPTRGLRASGGSLYLSSVLVPSAFFTVFVAAASKPDAAKFGFVLSSGGGPAAEPERERERGRR